MWTFSHTRLGPPGAVRGGKGPVGRALIRLPPPIGVGAEFPAGRALGLRPALPTLPAHGLVPGHRVDLHHHRVQDAVPAQGGQPPRVRQQLHGGTCHSGRAGAEGLGGGPSLGSACSALRSSPSPSPTVRTCRRQRSASPCCIAGLLTLPTGLGCGRASPTWATSR